MKVGANCKIGDYCTIEADVEIGKNVTIRNYVMLKKGTKIGDDCYIGSYFRSGGNDIIGNRVVIKCKTTSSPGVRIGDGSFIGPHVLLLHKTHGGTSMPCEIKEDVYIGGGATILPNVTVNKCATVGAGAVVTKDVTEGNTVKGNPAK